MEEDFGAPAADYDQRLYLASVETLLDMSPRHRDSHDRLLILGHNPGMEQLVLLLAQPGGPRDQIAAKYPTGALAELHFDGSSWRDVTAGAGRLKRFIRPRDLDPALGPER